MTKKRRGRKMAGWRKAAKAAIGLIGKGLGIAVAAGPAINAASVAMKSGVFEDLPGFVLDGYTGFNIKTGFFSVPQLTKGIASIVGGIVIMSLFSFLARKV